MNLLSYPACMHLAYILGVCVELHTSWWKENGGDIFLVFELIKSIFCLFLAESKSKRGFLEREHWKEKELLHSAKSKGTKTQKLKTEKERQSSADSGWGTPNSRYKGLTWMTFCSYRTHIQQYELLFFASIFLQPKIEYKFIFC